MSRQEFTHSSARAGTRIGIAAKILLAASMALIAGLLIVGGASLYLEKQALVGLQRDNSLTAANIVGDGIKSAMLSDDMKTVEAFIREMMEKKRAAASSVYNDKGEERGSGAKGDSSVTAVLQNNKLENTEEFENGVHVLKTVVPLPNEERCQKCHDKETRMLGAIDR